MDSTVIRDGYSLEKRSQHEIAKAKGTLRRDVGAAGARRSQAVDREAVEVSVTWRQR